jgi:putative FmdB family regulatory protein
MPIYEYECAACGRTFEEMQKISAAPLKKCSLCGAGKVRRLISQTSFQLKGTGWYVTDYARKKSGKAKAGKESDKGSGSGKKEGDPAPSSAAP